MITTEFAQKFLLDNFAPWVLDLQPQITQIDRDCAVLDIPLSDHIKRVGGIVSGQALAALADTAMVFACAGHFGKMVPVATTTLDTQFLRPASVGTIRGTARVVRAGKQVIFAQATMATVEDGKEIATATATFFIPEGQ